MKTFDEIREGKRPGLWDNIHAKRKRIKGGSGEKMRKPGSKGAPTAQDFKDASEEKKSLNTEDKKLTGKDAKGHKRATEKGAGLTQKGVDAYNRKTGGNLQTAVTTPPSKLKPGSKAAGRRKSFCARSRGWTGERGKAARRRWNC
tara:strand:- start:214 stop:648 length:435 start_codon:yes stop_codon:yes gene_type:complete